VSTDFSSTPGLRGIFGIFYLLRNRCCIALTGSMPDKCVAFGCKTGYDRQDSGSDEVPGEWR